MCLFRTSVEDASLLPTVILAEEEEDNNKDELLPIDRIANDSMVNRSVEDIEHMRELMILLILMTQLWKMLKKLMLRTKAMKKAKKVRIPRLIMNLNKHCKTL